MKFLTIYKLDHAIRAAGPSGDTMIAMGALIAEMKGAGVLLDTGGVDAEGMEFVVRRSGGTITVTDGPFTETKEVVGGFALLSCADRDEALMWTHRFLDAAGDGVSEVHQLGEYS